MVRTHTSCLHTDMPPHMRTCNIYTYSKPKLPDSDCILKGIHTHGNILNTWAHMCGKPKLQYKKLTFRF